MILRAQFDRALDPAALDTTLRVEGAQERVLRGALVGRDRLEVELSPGLGARQVLEDHTHYHWDLSRLRGQGGAPVDLTPLGPSGVGFTTARYDALLNHSCGHVLFGPYASATAAALPATAPRTDVGHTRYSVQLPSGGRGHVALLATTPTNFTLYFEQNVVLQLTLPDGNARAVSTSTVPRACAGIERRAELSLPAGRSTIELGSNPQETVHYIVEITPGG